MQVLIASHTHRAPKFFCCLVKEKKRFPWKLDSTLNQKHLLILLDLLMFEPQGPHPGARGQEAPTLRLTE